MSKTPEELAEEYVDENSGGECGDDTGGLRNAFLAGYKAAMESTEWQMRTLNNLDELIKEPSEND